MYSQPEIILMLATEYQRTLVEEAEQRRWLAAARRARRAARQARREQQRQARAGQRHGSRQREVSPPAGSLASCEPAGA